MIPTNQEELTALAGEYVLGVLDAREIHEIEAAIATNAELRAAIAFWEGRLHPLSALAPPSDPPPGLWDGIVARLDRERNLGTVRLWNRPAPWRWSTAGFAAIAAGLLLYIALTPMPSAPSFIAVLHAPQRELPSWVATAGRTGLRIRSIAGGSPPSGRAFELWAIGVGSTRPRSLGVIPTDGVLKLGMLPADLGDGTTLAISIEPIGGSPTGQPTGPVVFVGEMKAL